MREHGGYDNNNDAPTSRVYVVLGTSDRIQYRSKAASPDECRLSDGLQSRIHAIVDQYDSTLIAEEAPYCDFTIARQLADKLMIPYLQIDPFPHELEHGIRAEMDLRTILNSKQEEGADYRCPHADEMRENIWLNKIEKHPSVSRVLVVCGYTHTTFLAKKARDRGYSAEEVFFPEYLRERKIVQLPDS